MYNDPSYNQGMHQQPYYPPPVQPVVVVNNRPPARAFHLVMILATCGAWVPIWVICEIIHASKN